MRVALVYDRVNKFGGAERVLSVLHELFPNAPLYTLVYDPPRAKWASKFKVIPTFVNALPFLRSKHELLAPIAPMAFETLNFDEFDLVISVTSSDAKSIITKPHTVHLCYCLTPTRYFWSGEQEYQQDLKMRLLPQMIKKYLRTVDLLTSTRPDHYIAISEAVKDRIKMYYQRDSSVVYPPIEDKFFTQKPEGSRSRQYYLVVSRLVPYKHVELVVKAFKKINRPLLVIGSGSELKHLKQISGRNTKFLGQVSDDQLIDYYRKAKAVIFPQEEDYGLVPLESQACGTPVLAYEKGGALETVLSNKTGLFFAQQTPDSLVDCIEKFEKLNVDYSDCVTQAKKFSMDKFKKQFMSRIDQLLAASPTLPHKSFLQTRIPPSPSTTTT